VAGREHRAGAHGCGWDQLGDRTDRVASPQVRVRNLLKIRGDFLIRAVRRLRRVPGTPLRVLGVVLGQPLMDHSTLLAGRKLNNGGSNQGVAVAPSTKAVIAARSRSRPTIGPFPSRMARF
jgi:hypothetical protein